MTDSYWIVNQVDLFGVAHVLDKTFNIPYTDTVSPPSLKVGDTYTTCMGSFASTAMIGGTNYFTFDTNDCIAQTYYIISKTGALRIEFDLLGYKFDQNLGVVQVEINGKVVQSVPTANFAKSGENWILNDISTDKILIKANNRQPLSIRFFEESKTYLTRWYVKNIRLEDWTDRVNLGFRAESVGLIMIFLTVCSYFL